MAAGLCPDPLGELKRAPPDPIAAIWGPTLREGRRGKGEGGEGRGGEGNKRMGGEEKGKKERGMERMDWGGRMGWCGVTLERTALGDIYPNFATVQHS